MLQDKPQICRVFVRLLELLLLPQTTEGYIPPSSTTVSFVCGVGQSFHKVPTSKSVQLTTVQYLVFAANIDAQAKDFLCGESIIEALPGTFMLLAREQYRNYNRDFAVCYFGRLRICTYGHDNQSVTIRGSICTGNHMDESSIWGSAI